MKSWFRTCSNSCRGTGGAMHSKLYLFSKVGPAEAGRDVVVGQPDRLGGQRAVQRHVHDHRAQEAVPVSIKVFNEASKDRPAPWHGYKDGTIRGWFTPNKGRPDLPYQDAQRGQVQGRQGCRHPRPHLDPDRPGRLQRRSRREDRPQDQGAPPPGCNIRWSTARWPAVVARSWPASRKNHLVSDRDGDGAYDIYLHMKAMSISGFYGTNRGARIVFNGTANFSGIGLIADENGLVIERDGVERQYGRQINKLFNIHLHSVPLDPEVREDVERGMVIDPYRNMEG